MRISRPIVESSFERVEHVGHGETVQLQGNDEDLFIVAKRPGPAKLHSYYLSESAKRARASFDAQWALIVNLLTGESKWVSVNTLVKPVGAEVRVDG